MSYSVATTVLSAAESYSLTDLDTVRDELSITSPNNQANAWLTRAITQVSSAIATYTKRVFAPELVRDAFDIEQDAYPYQTPGGFPALVLARWPAIAIQSVAQTLALGTTQTLTEGTDFRANLATGELLRINPFTGAGTAWEAVPVTVTYMAGYGSLATEAHTVPASPYKVTVAQSSAFSCDQWVTYANGAALTRVTANPAAGQYSVAAGVYTFAAADAGQALTFAYGIKRVPDDLVEATLRLVTARYRAKDRDPALVQQETPGIGVQRWWFGSAPGQKGPFPPDIEALLEPYCMPLVA